MADEIIPANAGYISAGATAGSLGEVVFSNSNGVSFGMAGQTITASVNAGGGGSLNLSAGTTSNNLTNFQFNNSNGVSFGLNGSTVTATVATNYQSQGAYLTTAMASDAGSNFVGLNSALTGNGVSATINSSGISLNVPAFLTTAQPVGAYLTTAMLSNAATISNIKISAGTLSALRSDISFNNSNGISFGLETNGIITATVATNYQSQGAYLTTAMASNRGSDFVQANAAFAGTNASGTIASDGISVSVNAQSAVPQNVSLFALGNTTQNSSTQLSVNALSFNAIGSITMGYSNGSIQVSAPNALTTAMASNASTQFVQANAAFAGTNASGTIASNGISVSVNAGGGGAALKGSGTYTQNTGTIEFANSNGITFGLSNNGTMTASHNGLTTAMASNRGSDFMGTNTALTANGVSMTANSSGLSLNFPAFLTTAALSNHSHAFATTTTNGALIVVATTNSNGATIAVPPYLTTAQSPGAYLTTARASNDAIGLNTALTANGVAWTVNSSGLSLNIPAFLTTAMQTGSQSQLWIMGNSSATVGGTNISGTMYSNGLSLSAAAPGGGGAINVSAGTTSGNLQTVVFSNSNGVSFGLNGSTVTASVDVGGGGFNQRWEQIEAFRFSLSNLTNITAISNVPFFQPFKFYGNMTLSRVNWEMSRATSGSNAFTVTAGIYSYSNSTALSLIASATGVFSNTATASVSGIRRFALGGFNVSTFTQGGYVFGMQFNAGANTVSMNYSIRGYSGAVQAGAIVAGSDSYNTATNYNIFPFFGRYSTTVPFLTSVAESAIRGQFSGASAPINAWIGFNND